MTGRHSSTLPFSEFFRTPSFSLQAPRILSDVTGNFSRRSLSLVVSTSFRNTGRYKTFLPDLTTTEPCRRLDLPHRWQRLSRRLPHWDLIIFLACHDSTAASARSTRTRSSTV